MTSSSNPFQTLSPQRVLVTGGTGFIGSALVNQLLDAGHTVTLLARKPVRAAKQFQARVRCVPSSAALGAEDAFDSVINLAGAPVLGPRWSPRRQAQLLDSRVGVTQSLLQWMDRAVHKPTMWLQASAIGYYGVRSGDEWLTESSAPGRGFMSALCHQWEASARPVADQGVRLVVLRLGVVLGPGGALPPMLLPHRLGMGGRLGDGQQVMSWIHRHDVLHIMARAMADTRMQGTYNAVAPGAVRQAEFARTVGAVLHRPVWLHLPAAPLRWAAGEMAELLLDGQRVVPQRLVDAGYVFAYPGLQQALEDLV